jgi:hypothetical protein
MVCSVIDFSGVRKRSRGEPGAMLRYCRVFAGIIEEDLELMPEDVESADFLRPWRIHRLNFVSVDGGAERLRDL